MSRFKLQVYLDLARNEPILSREGDVKKPQSERRFLQLIGGDKTVGELRLDIAERATKLYPDDIPSYKILRLQDGSGFDLDDDYLVKDIFQTEDKINVVGVPNKRKWTGSDDGVHINSDASRDPIPTTQSSLSLPVSASPELATASPTAPTSNLLPPPESANSSSQSRPRKRAKDKDVKGGRDNINSTADPIQPSDISAASTTPQSQSTGPAFNVASKSPTSAIAASESVSPLDMASVPVMEKENVALSVSQQDATTSPSNRTVARAKVTAPISEPKLRKKTTFNEEPAKTGPEDVSGDKDTGSQAATAAAITSPKLRASMRRQSTHIQNTTLVQELRLLAETGKTAAEQDKSEDENDSANKTEVSKVETATAAKPAEDNKPGRRSVRAAASNASDKVAKIAAMTSLLLKGKDIDTTPSEDEEPLQRNAKNGSKTTVKDLPKENDAETLTQGKKRGRKPKNTPEEITEDTEVSKASAARKKRGRAKKTPSQVDEVPEQGIKSPEQKADENSAMTANASLEPEQDKSNKDPPASVTTPEIQGKKRGRVPKAKPKADEKPAPVATEEAEAKVIVEENSAPALTAISQISQSDLLTDLADKEQTTVSREKEPVSTQDIQDKDEPSTNPAETIPLQSAPIAVTSASSSPVQRWSEISRFDANSSSGSEDEGSGREEETFAPLTIPPVVGSSRQSFSVNKTKAPLSSPRRSEGESEVGSTIKNNKRPSPQESKASKGASKITTLAKNEPKSGGESDSSDSSDSDNSSDDDARNQNADSDDDSTSSDSESENSSDSLALKATWQKRPGHQRRESKSRKVI
ncbi:hypothetical protein BGW38_002190 [Lunasporangiospora selenospora]|uniref:Nucleolar protein Dnt1-like N-terminal domain-containing protein n=1 Tax=Lunasporangiospora selenospora TaxID=979761 RepID=A0A9P6KDJ6_9FUNG|nr:hypothetical protein BGW38_002190 [Lunasporangiospora selenospora]